MEYRDFYSDLSEDYPENWNLDTFKSMGSFSKRIQYCNQTLKRLASGSARVVYRIDDQKVLKLAKNEKGIAQNASERDWYVQDAYEDIVAKVFDVDEHDYWLEMEFAHKLTPTKFKQIVGVDVKQVGNYLTVKLARDNGRKTYFSVDPQVEQQLDNNEWVQRLYSMCREVDFSPGDFGRLSSFGETVREGKPSVVVIDLGLTQSVFDDFYKVN